ncbi:MAG: STAS domain-containing protein [Chlorobiaceae bacterium]|jgi:anti-anti-sigma factor|nr:STAS domain-containing protein [Chlorobiaceae bacterium]
MKHSVSTRKELTILKLEESIFDVRYADWFKSTIDNMVSNAFSRNVIIDFSQVKAIDSSGIGSMLLAHQVANRSDGLAIFVSLCQQIKDLLKLTNLDKQLYIFSSINEVMTLIEPALKGKRGSKSRPPQVQDDIVDDIADVIDILPEEVFVNEPFPEMDEVIDVSDSDEAEDIDELDKKEQSSDDNQDDFDEEELAEKTEKRPKADHPSRKRGRPKKEPRSGNKKVKTGD